MSHAELESFFCDGEEMAAATHRLVDCGCCWRCIVRFLGAKQTSVFRWTDQELRYLISEICAGSSISNNSSEDGGKESQDGTGVTMQTISVCVACLGILQEHFMDEVIDSICACIERSHYQFTTFICSVSVPVSTVIRKHSLWIHMKESFSNVYSSRSEADIVDIKEVWKWRCGPVVAERLGVPFDQKSKFSVSVSFLHDKSHDECSFLRDLDPGQFARRKTKSNRSVVNPEVFSRPVIARTLSSSSDEKFKSLVRTPPLIPKQGVTCGPVRCEHEPLYVAGRYNKYSRHLSQTPWIIDDVRISQSSVEELVSRVIQEKFQSKDTKFSSSGREDVDVRMLGTGRPFVLELIDPHAVNFSPGHMANMQKAINSETDLIQVRDLQIVTREDTKALKEGEENKRKLYMATCWAGVVLTPQHMNRLTQLEEINIKQKTPIRVLHRSVVLHISHQPVCLHMLLRCLRRNLATRKKTIHSLIGEIIDDHHFKLRLSTQAGTYIKEFVHSDFGRTSPSLGDLLECDCDILQLDVEEIEIDWPKRLDDQGQPT